MSGPSLPLPSCGWPRIEVVNAAVLGAVLTGEMPTTDPTAKAFKTTLVERSHLNRNHGITQERVTCEDREGGAKPSYELRALGFQYPIRDIQWVLRSGPLDANYKRLLSLGFHPALADDGVRWTTRTLPYAAVAPLLQST